ncbi:vesicle transport v-SNARE protein N-terminus-domain-containing protein [Pholiota molesta]|nr:vesicle transport v-SNARE protein N-terminus-domain-containing protein [Pholiota molesta]
MDTSPPPSLTRTSRTSSSSSTPSATSSMTLPGLHPLTARKAALRRAEMELDEADEMVSQMDIEIQGIPQSVRAQYHTRLRTAKTELAAQKKRLADARAQAPARTSSPPRTPRRRRRGVPGVGRPLRHELGPHAAARGHHDPRGGSSACSSPSASRSRRSPRARYPAQSAHAAGTDRELAEYAATSGFSNRPRIRDTKEDGSPVSTFSAPLPAVEMYQQRAVTYSIIGVLVLLIIVITWEKLS